jgi:hypothetical protein
MQADYLELVAVCILPANLPKLFGKIQIGLGNFALVGGAHMSFQRLRRLVEQSLQFRGRILTDALAGLISVRSTSLRLG